MIQQVKDRVNDDAELVRRGRYCDIDLMIEVGTHQYHLAIRGGRIVEIDGSQPLMRPWQVAVRADEAAWRRFWQLVPEPGYHDIFAMTKSGAARIEGELQPFMANLRYLKDVLAAPRGLAEEA